MKQYQAFYQCKPDSGTDMSLRIIRIDFIETFKHLGYRFGRDTDACILDQNTESPNQPRIRLYFIAVFKTGPERFLIQPGLDDNMPSVACVLESIVQ